MLSKQQSDIRKIAKWGIRMVIEDVGDYATFSKVGNYVASVYVESGSSKIIIYLTACSPPYNIRHF